MLNLYRSLCLSLLLSALPAVASDAVNISQAWARASAPGQTVGAAYMHLQSSRDMTLIKVESPAADSVEIHSMTMNNGVMKMRMLESLPLKAGKLEKLEPGGFHLMLFDLKKPLKVGEKIDLTLQFKDAAGKNSELKISAPIKAGADQ